VSKEEFSLSVTPTRLVVGPADLDTTQQLLVVNRGRSSMPVQVQKRNFVSMPDGTLHYQDDAPYGGADLVTVEPTQFELAPGTSQVITVKIDAATETDSGDQQLAVVVLVPATETEANIRVNRGVGAPVYLTLPGPVEDSVALSDLHAPAFVARGPVDLSMKVRNLGTVHHDFRGPSALTVRSAGASTAFPDFTVPRDATRDISMTWDPPLLCLCHPTVSYTDPAGATQTVAVRVIVFPWDLVLGALGALGLALLAVRLARRSFRSQVAKAAAASGSSSNHHGA